MLYAFDLDGTLIDSHGAVYQAYKEAGVTPPDDFFVKPWRDWLKDEEIHHLKNKIYLRMIPSIKPLPLLRLYHDLEFMCRANGFGNPPWIFTGASKEAVAAISEHFNLHKETIISEMGIYQKIHTMNIAPKPGVMFEDQRQAAEQMRRDTKWAICHTM